MKETRAIPFLRSIAAITVAMVLVAAVLGEGALGQTPSTFSEFVTQLRQGGRDGFMGVGVLAVLVAPVAATLIVAAESRRVQPRHLTIALVTSGVLVVSIVISAIAS